MPMITKCPLCGFEGNHGFDLTNGGLRLWHSENKDGGGASKCHYFIGDDKKVYKTHLELFKSVTMPRALKDGRESTTVWCKARIADLSGHARKAKQLYKQWQELDDQEKGI